MMFRPLTRIPARFTFTLIAAGLTCFCAYTADAQSITFDFETAIPGQSTPLSQTSNGLTAQFTTPSSAAFSIQSVSNALFQKLSKFSGNYLYPNGLSSTVLDIRFSQAVTKVTMTFATADYQQVEVPNTVLLTAAFDSNPATQVGTASAHGTWAGDSLPMGTLTFDSTGQPFNLVRLTAPINFLIDNITVSTAAPAAVSCVSAATYIGGHPLSPGSIVSSFGQNLASTTGSAMSNQLPVQLANTTVSLTDSNGTVWPAGLFYVGPTQINFLIPDTAATGAATFTIRSDTQAALSGSLTIGAVAPGLFTKNADGNGVPAGFAIKVAPDNSQTRLDLFLCGPAAGSCIPSPIDLGPVGTQTFLELYGTGIRGRTSLAGVTATIGGISAEVIYAGTQPQYSGLDQVDVRVPVALAGPGTFDLVLTVDGIASNITQIAIK